MYSTGRFANAKVLAEEILTKIDSGFTEYEATSGIFANYYLGRIWESNFDTDKAILCYQRTVDYSERHQAFESEYYHYSLFALAEIYDKQGNRKEAENCLKTLRKNSRRSSDVNKRARELLKSLGNRPKER
jgi:tetratricopeptide (TPR) repeat protein